MSFFDLFKKKNNKVEISYEMMNENQFWSIIEKAKDENNDLDIQLKNYQRALKILTNEELIGFKLREEKLRFDSYNSEIWCAAYIINGGCSDDSFEYFRCWLISQGQKVFYSTLENPDFLSNLYNPEIEDYDFEDLLYVCDEQFEKNTKKDIMDFIDYDKFSNSEGNYPKINFNWEEEDPESMKKICPTLFELVDF